MFFIILLCIILFQMIDSYIKEIDAVYGTYLDSTIGFKMLSEKFKALKPDFTKSLHIGNGDPNLKESYALHSVRFDTFFARNDLNGDNHRLMSNMALTTIYQLWEDHYREPIANHFGLKKNELKNDLFGDLRIIRQGIIHNNGCAISDFKKLKIFDFLKESKGQINISAKQLEIIINELKMELIKLETLKKYT